MMDLYKVSVDTLHFIHPCNISFMVQMEKRSQIHFSPNPSIDFLFSMKWSWIGKRCRTRIGEVRSASVENYTGRRDKD